MAKTIRKGLHHEVLNKGETYDKKKKMYRYTYVDAVKERRSIYAKSLLALRDREKELVRAQHDGLDIYLMGKANINFVFDRYMATKTNLKNTTLNNYYYMYDHYVRGGFGRRKIAVLKFSDIILFYKSLLDDEKLTINTVESIHTLLHPTFTLAVRDDIIRNNPSDGVMAELKKRYPKNSGVRRALTSEQEKKFLGYLDNPDYDRWKPIFTVMFGTGCRVGELTGLRWEDINLDDKTISVNHNLTYTRKAGETGKSSYGISTTKTEAGERIIPMLDKVKEAFLREKEYQEITGRQCSSVIDGMSGFIFFNRFGAVHSASTLNKAIERIRVSCNAEEEIKARKEHREAVIIPHFTNHTARHTFCSRLCENETNIKVIQQVMGHKDVQTTLDIYAEVTDRKMKLAFDSLNENDVI